MNKIIRHRCFETNSSSAHSISIDDFNIEYDTIIDHNDTGVFCIELIGYEFGWEIEDYFDPITKLAYLLVDVSYSNEERKEFYNRLIKEVVLDHTGLVLIVKEPKLRSWDNYIDHQSIGAAKQAIHEGAGNDEERIKARIKNFVFNRNSVLHTDNDNH